MSKINLKEKEKKDIMNLRKIIFIVILSIILLGVASILLLIWWPTKPSLVEITNSWVALIMVYLILIIFLFEKPIYKFYNKFFAIIAKSGRHQARQAKQKELLRPISDSDFGKLVSYCHPEGDNILKREDQESNSTIREDSEVVKYIQKLQDESIKWRFLFADIYLVFYAKYVLFWLFKLKLAKREDFDKVWQLEIPDEQERRAILDALLSLDFVRTENDNLFITDLGSTYVNYLKKMDKHPNE